MTDWKRERAERERELWDDTDEVDPDPPDEGQSSPPAASDWDSGDEARDEGRRLE